MGNRRLLAVDRDHVRHEVMRHAWLLFAQNGFEATTIDAVVETSGLSRRTFFRYFTGKDELVLARLVIAGEDIAHALAGRPKQETPWQALHAALVTVSSVQDDQPEQSRMMAKILHTEPAARAIMEDRRRLWIARLGPLLEDRLEPGGDVSIRAAALAAAAIACLDAAQARWIETAAVTAQSLLDTAMNAVAPL